MSHWLMKLQVRFSVCFVMGLILNGSWRGRMVSAAKISQNTGRSYIRYAVEEETAAGYQVGNLLIDSELDKRHPPETLASLRFRFVAENVEHFDIGSTTGIIRTTSKIDRDNSSLCRQMELCEIHLSVVIQPVEYLQIIRIVIVVVDINDNSPTFRDSVVSLSIVEAASIGSSYILPTAQDWDSPTYGIKRYELDSSGGASAEVKFSIKTVEKLDGSKEVSLDLLGRLDREWEEEHRMRLTAYDGGIPSRSGVIDIIVKVLDSNDNKPEFSREKYQVGIMENVPAGTVILQVEATDRDAGLSGTVSYRFASHTKSTYGSLFGIRNSTGILFVKGPIDHEKSSVYHLIIVAEDIGSDPKTSEVTVVVHVEDVNDNPPLIVTSTLNVGDGKLAGLQGTTEGFAGVSENSAVGSFVAHVTVTDADDGFNGRVNCSIDSNSFTLIQKYTNEYQIVTAVLLDRERHARYSITLRCQDAGSVPLATDSVLNVKVIDVNDNPPVFTTNTYHGSLVENNFIGASILQVSANDWDEGDNAKIRYHIPSFGITNRVSFYVDQRGVVSVQDSIDREKYESFKFIILAIDLGKPAQTSSATVIINVVDVNDEKPVFVKEAYEFHIPENEPAISPVGMVLAVDRDTEPHNIVIYSFLNGHPTTDYFSIESRTGKISTRRALDRELLDKHELTVMARDHQLEALSSTVTVTIHVTDANDNSPVFLFPSSFNNTVQVSYLLPVGAFVAQALALDDDLGDNGYVTYEVTFDGDVTAFDIDSRSGHVVAKRSLKEYDHQSIVLSILAVDHGIPQRSTSALLNVIVNRTILSPAALSGSDSFLISLDGPFFYMLLAVLAGCAVVIVAIVSALMLVKRRERKRRQATKQDRMQDALRSLVSKDDATVAKLAEKQNDHCRIDAASISHDAEISPWLHADLDEKDSIHSGDGTDSGRGASEEGSSSVAGRLRYIPPPPPPTRSTLWPRTQLKPSQNGVKLLSDPSRHRVTNSVRFYGLKATPEEEGSEEVPMEHLHDSAVNYSSLGRDLNRDALPCCNGTALGGCGNAAGTEIVRGNGNTVGPEIVRGNGNATLIGGRANAAGPKIVRGNGNATRIGGRANTAGPEIARGKGSAALNLGSSSIDVTDVVRGNGNGVVTEFARSNGSAANIEDVCGRSAKSSICQSNVGSQSKTDAIGGDCYYIHLNKSLDQKSLPASNNNSDIRQTISANNVPHSFVL